MHNWAELMRFCSHCADIHSPSASAPINPTPASGNSAPRLARLIRILKGLPPLPMDSERMLARASCCGKVSISFSLSTIQLPPARMPERGFMSFVAQETHICRLIFLNAGITSDVAVRKIIIVQIIIRSGHLADNAFIRHGIKLVINSWNQGDPGAGLQFNYLTRLYLKRFVIHRNCEAAASAFMRNPCPNLHRQFSPAADDILLFLPMTVGGCRHAFPRIHEFFAILRFLRKIDKDQAELLPVTQAEIRDVPSRFRRQRPTVSLETGLSGTNESVDGATFHKEPLLSCFLRVINPGKRHFFPLETEAPQRIIDGSISLRQGSHSQ